MKQTINYRRLAELLALTIGLLLALLAAVYFPTDWQRMGAAAVTVIISMTLGAALFPPANEREQ